MPDLNKSVQTANYFLKTYCKVVAELSAELGYDSNLVDPFCPLKQDSVRAKKQPGLPSVSPGPGRADGDRGQRGLAQSPRGVTDQRPAQSPRKSYGRGMMMKPSDDATSFGITLPRPPQPKFLPRSPQKPQRRGPIPTSKSVESYLG